MGRLKAGATAKLLAVFVVDSDEKPLTIVK
jgi:hypothetical protein